jgi:hypothetical protein
MRTCIFCEGPASSKEDAWPLWLMRQLEADEAGRVEAQRGRQAPYSWRTAKGKLQVKFVCTSCNSGWMSQLENRVKPIVEGLLSDIRMTFDSSDQTSLAMWAVKNAMVFEALRPAETPWFFTNSERKVLRESQQLPPLTSVWIAKCVEFAGPYTFACDLAGDAEISGDPVRTFVITMGFGSLAIQVLVGKLTSSIPQRSTITGDLRPGPWDQVTIQIWPVQSERVSWPASMGLSGERGLDRFSQRWTPVNG